MPQSKNYEASEEKFREGFVSWCWACGALFCNIDEAAKPVS